MNSPQACRQTHRHLLCRVPENPTAVSGPCAHAPLFLSSILPQRLKRFNIINCKKQCREFFGWHRRGQLTPEARGAILPQFLSLRGREYRGGRFCLPACPDSPDCLFCGKAATVPPAARPHKLHIPRPAAGGRSRPFRCSSSPNCKRFAGLQFGSICLARKSRQKEALEDALYCALTRAIFWPLRSLNALFGRRIVIFPIAFGSDECTTRICGQTASISVLLISGILDRLWSCTAPCRGRWRAQPLATKERYGCGPPLAGAHRPFCPVAPDCR